MKIQDQTVVTMTYVLREKDENGRLIQEATKENPFTFICGMRRVLPKFEENLLGKEPGDHYCFCLAPGEGYVYDERQVISFSKEHFMENGVLSELVKEGAQLMFQTYQGPMAGVILEIGDDFVKIDFNSELAGKPLCFSGEILDVRETTDDDFKAGGCAGCGGDCDGGCDGGCEGCQ